MAQLYVDCRTDDEIRHWRLILSTLNKRWAHHPSNTIEETVMYIKRSINAGRSIDLHQNKDTTDDGQIFFPIADLTDIEEL